MAALDYLKRKRPHTTKRIVATVVREDELGDNSILEIPDNALRFWRDVIAAQPDYEPHKESLCVVMLSAHLKPIAWNRVSLGTLNSCNFHPREILRPVILAASFGFVLMHNHPSGNTYPSRADEISTRNLVEAARIMNLHFIDHIIIPTSGRPLEPGMMPYYSFREAGLIP